MLDPGTLITAAAFAFTGVMCIVFGRFGMAGKIDFNLATYTKENSTPESWHDAHQIMGRAMIQSGWVQIAGAVAILVFGLQTNMGYAGLTLAILGSLGPIGAMWPTFRVLERVDRKNDDETN